MTSKATPLSDLLAQLRAEPSEERLLAFCRFFMVSYVGVVATGRPADSDLDSMGFYETKTGDRIGLGQTRTETGRLMLLACADRAVYVKRFSQEFNADVLGRELAVMVQKNPDLDGVKVNSALGPYGIPIGRDRLIALLAERRDLPPPPGQVVVPPGHKVVVIPATARPGFARTDSGIWIFNIGHVDFLDSGIATLEQFLRTSSRASVLWILGRELLETLHDPEEFLRQARRLKALNGQVSHVVVFPDDVPSRIALMCAFDDAGFGVQYGGPERACLIEVHKPDGSIVVGMAGPAFMRSGG